MRAQVTLRDALADEGLLAPTMKGASWAAWRALMMAAMGEPLEPAELATFQKLTGRPTSPEERVAEFWGVIGRRGGKTRSMSVLATYIAGLCDHRDNLTTGERGVVLVIAPDQKQSRVTLDYVAGIFENSPLLAPLIANRTADSLELTTGISIEVRAASFRRLRGVTCVAVIADEASFWLSDESSNPDKEILDAVRPSLITTRGTLFVISSPYGRKGEVWETYRRQYGADGDRDILVAHGTSRDFNPSLPQSVIDRAMERDPASATSEYLAQFRSDVSGFLTEVAIGGCVDDGITVRDPDRNIRYSAYADPASGGGADSFCIGISHREGDTAVLDVAKEYRPPFNPESTIAEICDLLRKYRISHIKGDRYGAEFVRSLFSKNGVFYEPSEMTTSEIFLESQPSINSHAYVLLDDKRLLYQLANLERRTTRAGRDQVSHPPGGHDDLACAAIGSLVMAFKSSSSFVSMTREEREQLYFEQHGHKPHRLGADPLAEF